MGSAYTLTEQVQEWIDSTKLNITTVDPILVETAQTMVFSRLVRVYPMAATAWVDGGGVISQTNAPALVQKAVSLLIASWVYGRAYAEVTAEDENKYALRLESMAEDIVAAIESGIITLIDVDPTTYTPADEIDFMPGPTDGAAPIYNALGEQVGYQGSEDVKFRMATRF